MTNAVTTPRPLQKALQSVLDQCSRNQTERIAAVAEAGEEVERLSARVQATEMQILELTSQLADDYHRSEAEEIALDDLAARASVLRAERTAAHKYLWARGFCGKPAANRQCHDNDRHDHVSR